jgi:septum site-determining protein MinC
MEETLISFKATVNGLILVMKEYGDFDEIVRQMEKKLDNSGKFFKGASISVKYRGRKLSAQEEDLVKSLLASKTGAEIKSFEEDTEPEKDSSEQVKASSRPKDKLKMKKLFFKGIEEGMTKFYRGTVRSGGLIDFEGNVVVIGDVNPGGEVIATGNVVVMGSLRGIVHAGADGNRDAVVVALNLQPTQLRIADVITRPPDEIEIKHANIPEIALVRDNTIYIERFLPQFK